MEAPLAVVQLKQSDIFSIELGTHNGHGQLNLACHSNVVLFIRSSYRNRVLLLRETSISGDSCLDSHLSSRFKGNIIAHCVQCL